MSGKPFHLGWFVDAFRAPAWKTRYEGSSSRDWVNGRFFVDAARAMERASLDFMLVAEASYIADAHGGSVDATLRYGRTAPNGDLAALVPILAHETTHLGFLPTLSVTEWKPFPLARYLSTLGHISNGRVGWNMVTSSNDRAAQNYGFDRQPPHDERYDIADEFVDVVRKLWGSWDDHALVMDRESGVYVDGSKVHAIDHVGKYFKVRGPLTTLPVPHGMR